MPDKPEEGARRAIDAELTAAGWIVHRELRLEQLNTVELTTKIIEGKA